MKSFADASEAFNARDYEACLETIDSRVRAVPPDIPNAKVAHGRDALIAHFSDWLAAWDEYRGMPEEMREGPDGTVLVITTESARGRGSGIQVLSRRATGVYRLRAGKIVYFRAYLDHDAALEAAGLTE